MARPAENEGGLQPDAFTGSGDEHVSHPSPL
jgi:hypothetical protein